LNDSDKVHTFRIGLLSSIGTIMLLWGSEIMLEILKKIGFLKIPDGEIYTKIILFFGFVVMFVGGSIIFKYSKLDL